MRRRFAAVLGLLISLSAMLLGSISTVVKAERGIAVSLQATPAVADDLQLAVEQALGDYLGRPPSDKVIVSTIAASSDWVYGTIGIFGATERNKDPQGLVFLAEQAQSVWRVAIERTQRFEDFVSRVPVSVMPASHKVVFTTEVGMAGDGSGQFSLPWATGETQYLTGGPHGSVLDGIDFSGGSGGVRAAREGTAYVVCPNKILIRHDDGVWSTGYYHIANIAVANGQRVTRGQYLGAQSAQSGCGGSATGAHLHFWTEKSAKPVGISNQDIGGWTVSYSGSAYNGCMTRLSDGNRQCVVWQGSTLVQKGTIYNSGVIGSGIVPPEGYIDGPTPNQTVSNTFTVRGWARVNGSSIQRVEVWIDGTHRANANYPENRSDVGNIGYSWSWDTRQYGNGNHTVQVKAVAANGTSAWLKSSASGSGGTTTIAVSVQNNQAPHIPQQVGPANGAVLNSRTATLSWRDTGDPDNQPRNYRDYYAEIWKDDNSWRQTLNWTAATSWTINVPSDGPYSWRVQSGDGAVASGWSPTWKFTVDATLPTGGITAPAQGSVITDPNVTITANAGDNLSGVKQVEFFAHYNGEWRGICVDVTAPYTCSWNASSLADQDITLTIHVVDHAGNKAIDAGGYRVIKLSRTLASPSNLRVASATDAAITLAWDDNASNEIGFNIYKWDGIVGEFKLLAKVGANAAQYTDSRLDCEGTYYYEVRAYNSDGESDPTGWIEAKTAVCPVRTPHSLAVKQTGHDRLTLTWQDDSTNETGFKIFRWDYKENGWDFYYLTSVGSNATTWTDTGLSCVTDYYYQVSAFNSSHESRRSDWVRGTTNACPSDPPKLSLTPSTSVVRVGQIFMVEIAVNTSTQTADTVDAYLGFDPRYLEVVDAAGNLATTIESNATVFSGATTNTVDNTAGRIDFSASKYSSPYLTGSFSAATIRFRAKAAVESTPINFMRSGVRQSALLQGGESLNATLDNGAVNVVSGMVLNGRVALERRGEQGSVRWVTPLFRETQSTKTHGITLFAAGTSTIRGSFSATTDVNGRFSVVLDGIEAGTYDMQVKGSNTLSRKKLSVTLPMSEEIDFGTLLVGDGNGDDVVNGADVSYMVPSFLLARNDAGFRPYADTNNDGVVNGTDISALIPNFLRSGPAMSGSASVGPTDGMQTANRARLSLSSSQQTVRRGDIFSVVILADTGSSSADTVDAYLDFDPRYLEVVDAAGNPASDIEINTAVFSSATYNSAHNTTGQINLSASRYSGSLLTGSFDVATIRFRAKAAVEASQVIFAQSGARKSDIMRAGDTLNPELTGYRVAIVGSGDTPPPPSVQHRVHLPMLVR
jgi:hypothetical protein